MDAQQKRSLLLGEFPRERVFSSCVKISRKIISS
jgi:hypothetical protein